jgi:hypothetical protein
MVFSGRPDPEWILDESSILDLGKRIRALVRNEEQIQVPNSAILGYRGFLVTNNTGIREIPAEFSVFKGVFTERADKKVLHIRDSQGIESLLLEDARHKGFGDLLDDTGTADND